MLEHFYCYIEKTFADVHPLDSWGEKSFFLNPQKQLKRGTYFATLKEKDGENDKASFLNRNGIFRLNMGVTKDCYLSLFSHSPKRPAKGGIIEGDYDFTQTDIILPHPVYGWMSWLSVLNPSEKTFEQCKDLLAIAYDKAHHATQKKLAKEKTRL